MDLIKSFLLDVVNGKFKCNEGNVKFTKLALKDKRYEPTYKWLYEKYVVTGMGLKSMIKDYSLPVSYTFLRNLLIKLGFTLHSSRDANDFLRNRRSVNAKNQFINKTGFFKNGVQENIHNKSIKRGIQGYYWNVSKKKYVWLRSSWEFIYAKWLNKQNNIIWDVECEQYHLSDNTSYRPDFFIFNKDGDVVKVVEIKGYWKDKAYKPILLKEEYNLDAVMIEDITPYCDKPINTEIKEWKKLRKLE